MSQELIALFMFASMMLMLFTGQRVFGAIGAIGAIAILSGYRWSGYSIYSGHEIDEMVSAADSPLFIFMGYVLLNQA